MEYAFCTFTLPQDYVSGGTLRLNGQVNATSNAYKLQAQVGAVTSADADTKLEHAWAAAATVTTNVNTNEARRLQQATITLTMDSAAAGDSLTIMLFRDATDGSDTSTADYELVDAEFDYTGA